MEKPNIVAVIPAHNEERVITETIKDLLNQTLPVNKILIVVDKCTDRTSEIVCQIKEKYSQIQLMETVNNASKKAGAINQALYTLQDDVDAVLLMDADTRIDKKAIQEGWKIFSANQRIKIASVCSKAGILPYKGWNPLEWILYRLQRLEYPMFDSQRIETRRRVKVIHGMAALHSWKALREVGFYDEGNLVEDYDLTIRYKKAGWIVTANLDMKAWTTVPISWKEWWKQRLRWNRGGVDTLQKHGWGEVTRGDILHHIWGNILLLLQWFFLVVVIMSVFIHEIVLMHGVVLVAIALGLADSMYRLRYIEKITVMDFIIRIMIIPELLYGYIRTLNLYHAYILFFFNRKQTW